MRKQTLRRTIAYVITLAMLGYIFITVDIETVIDRYLELSWRDLVFLLALMLSNLLLGSLRLERLLVYFGTSGIQFIEVIRANVAGLLSSLVFVNIVGSLLGRHYVLRRNGVSVAALTAIVTLERILLVLISGCLLAAGLTALFGLETLFAAARKVALIEVISVILLIILVLFSTFRWQREISVFRQLLSARYSLRLCLLALITFAANAVMLLTYVISAHALGVVEVDWLSLAAAATIVAFAAGLPISVNGWGIREVSAIYAFGHLGISAAEATAVSVLVGLVSTAAILISTPVLALKQSSKAIEKHPPTLNEQDKPQGNSIVQANTAFLLFAGPFAALLVFVTLHVPFRDTLIAINLADPLAILALSLAGLSWLSAGQPPLRFPKPFGWWVIGLSLLILSGFLNGAARFGVTEWALNNRLVGWAVLMGYLALGAMIVRIWGNHGLRRIAEVVLTTGAVIVVFDLFHREFFSFFDNTALIASNFEGFSMNRNAFAFQLLIAASAGLAYSKVIARTRLSTAYCLLLGAVFMGIWRTYSMTGIVTAIGLGLGMLLFGMVDRRIVLRSLLWIAFFVAAAWVLRWTLGLLLLADSPDITAAAPNLYILSTQTERWMAIQKGLEIWYQNPVFGAGLGAFANLRLGEAGKILVMHSVPVWLLAEFGVLGFALVASLPAAFLSRALRWRLSSLPPHVVFLIAVTVCFTVFGMTHDIFYQRVFWLVLGGCVAAWASSPYRPDRQRRPSSVSRP